MKRIQVGCQQLGEEDNRSKGQSICTGGPELMLMGLQSTAGPAPLLHILFRSRRNARESEHTLEQLGSLLQHNKISEAAGILFADIYSLLLELFTSHFSGTPESNLACGDYSNHSTNLYHESPLQNPLFYILYSVSPAISLNMNLEWGIS